MVELTEKQVESLRESQGAPPRLVNPQTSQTYVLIPLEEYERLAAEEYDDSPWTREELQSLAWEAGKELGWEEMDEYDDTPETP